MPRLERHDARILIKHIRDDTLGRSTLSGVFSRLEAEGLLGVVYSDGTVRNESAFIADILREGSLPFEVFFKGKQAGFTWFNTFEGRTCRGHFCFYKAFWGREKTIPLGREIMRHVLTLRDKQGYLFDVVIGQVPKRNRLAVAMAKYWGGDIVGDLPYGAYNAKENTSETATITAVTRESLIRSYHENL